ncbi:hypothetical protein SH579_07330 [Raoultella ornithinolytica]|uniref:hypothetical protein n=1 Tax=Raoultella ornithinolytica TaxID=54291 RepID=UPI002A5B0A1F|nr:hypothetical protein [Raoultella ornithinolytica]WPO20727.1 hypothetical protein SH579_07330 [Raoultella ornithinolytica]
MTKVNDNTGINEMLEWLNTHVGTDWATYQGWILGVAGVGVSLYGLCRATPILKQKTNNIRVKQKVKNIQGDLNLAGRDINTTTNNHYAGVDENTELLKKKRAHDLNIIEEILTLLPYEETIDQVERSYIVGMLYQFSRDLEDAEKYAGEKYSLFNTSVNNSKNLLIESVKTFNCCINDFLSVDHPDRTPLRLDLPYDWRNNGGESEKTYRRLQNNMREMSGILIERYRDFVLTFKQHDFITDKL